MCNRNIFLSFIKLLCGRGLQITITGQRNNTEHRPVRESLFLKESIISLKTSLFLFSVVCYEMKQFIFQLFSATVNGFSKILCQEVRLCDKYLL